MTHIGSRGGHIFTYKIYLSKTPQGSLLNTLGSLFNRFFSVTEGARWREAEGRHNNDKRNTNCHEYFQMEHAAHVTAARKVHTQKQNEKKEV